MPNAMPHKLAAERLHHGVTQLALNLTDAQIEQMLTYVTLIQKWNTVYNLTAVRDLSSIIDLHLLDCLAVLTHLKLQLRPDHQTRIIDVGSGAGLPGILFAICLPEVTVHSIDTVKKKSAFQQQAKTSLNLSNFHAYHARIEKWVVPIGTATAKPIAQNLDQPVQQILVSRAFAALTDIVSWTEHLLQPGDLWFSMKGEYPHAEIAALPLPYRTGERLPLKVTPIRVPGLDVRRHVVCMIK
jgi:16S rRNA (guanine527-N7)-methyltransferase